ncbi:MAG: hypothetical protein ACOYUZ_00350 [Patescibacteria group bacterium]
MAHGHNRRHRNNQPRHHGRPGMPHPVSKQLDGIKGSVTAVREEKDPRGNVHNLVLEERFNVPIPNAVKDRVQSLFVKRNSTADAERKSRVINVRSHLLVITFREPQIITGLPVSPAKARKLAKMSFTHVTIERLPEEASNKMHGHHDIGEYDERSYRIVWWKPKAGHRRGAEKGGEAVYELCDELAVLQWLYENGLAGLYGHRVLTSWKLLPLRDEDREHENAITAQMQMVFGHLFCQPHEQRDFHRTRLLSRLIKHCGVDQDAALEIFAQTVVGKRARSQIDAGTFASQTFYFSQEMGLAYGIWNLPEARYIMCVDLKGRKAHLEPMRVDAHGLDLMEAYHECLTSEKFEQVEWRTFQSLISGIGTARDHQVARAN